MRVCVCVCSPVDLYDILHMLYLIYRKHPNGRQSKYILVIVFVMCVIILFEPIRVHLPILHQCAFC